MSVAKRLDQISSVFFFVGFVISKLELIPLFVMPGLFNFLSIGLYFTGYALWITSCCLYPDHTRIAERWYGFSQYKNQYRLAAIVGGISSALFLGAIFIPILSVPAVWIFAISNCVWFIAEYHKLNHPPPHEHDFTEIRQQTYLRYVGFMTLLSIAAAIGITISVFCPPIAVTVISITTLVSVGLGAAALIYWLETKLSHFEPKTASVETDMTSSYTYVTQETRSQSPGPTRKLVCEEHKSSPPPLPTPLATPKKTLPPATAPSEESTWVDLPSIEYKGKIRP